MHYQRCNEGWETNIASGPWRVEELTYMQVGNDMDYPFGSTSLFPAGRPFQWVCAAYDKVEEYHKIACTELKESQTDDEAKEFLRYRDSRLPSRQQMQDFLISRGNQPVFDQPVLVPTEDGQKIQIGREDSVLPQIFAVCGIYEAPVGPVYCDELSETKNWDMQEADAVSKGGKLLT